MKVKKAAVSSLGWTGAVDDAALVLESMDDDTFSQAARELSRERLPVGLRPRVVAAIHRVLDTAGDPWDRLRAVSGLIELGEPALDERLKRALDDIPTDEVQKHGHYLIRPTLERLRQRDPGWVSEWVASRIVDGGLWPEHWIGFVTDVPGELAEKALQRLEN
jgi:hypothetical protein